MSSLYETPKGRRMPEAEVKMSFETSDGQREVRSTEKGRSFCALGYSGP